MEDFVIYDKFGNEKKNIYGRSMTNPQFKKEEEQSSILEFEDALVIVSYPKYILEYIKKFLIENYSDSDMAEIFMITNEDGEKIFVIEYSLIIELNNKNYKVFLLVYLPILFPNYPPEFYIKKTANILVNKFYLDGKINENDLKINLDHFVKFDPNNNNIGEIIDNLVINFTQEFPVYKDNINKDKDWRNSGKCVLDKSKANKIKLPIGQKSYSNNDLYKNGFNYSEKNNNFNNVKVTKLNNETNNSPFNDSTFLEYIKKQTKDIIGYNYVEFIQKYNIKGNLDNLKNIENKSIQKFNNDNLYRKNEQLKTQVQALKSIKAQLLDVEKRVERELKESQNSNKKDFFENFESFVDIPNKEDFEFLIQIKVMEDYLSYLKKGFEKRIVGFDDIVNLTRSISRQIFYLNYMRSRFPK